MNKQINRGILIAGLQQSGKTYFTEQLSKQKNIKGFTLVYNVGRPQDWSEATELIPVTPQHYNTLPKKEQAKIRDNFTVVEYYILPNGKVLHAKDIQKYFKNKTVKIYRSEFESQIIKSIYLYMSGGLVIFDDFRSSTRHGLKSQMLELFSRQNHTGQKNETGKNGMDIVWIYHNLDTPPDELTDYVSHFVLFKLNAPPKPPTGDNQIDSAILTAIEKVKTLPKYSHAIIQIRDCEAPITNYRIVN